MLYTHNYVRHSLGIRYLATPQRTLVVPASGLSNILQG